MLASRGVSLAGRRLRQLALSTANRSGQPRRGVSLGRATPIDIKGRPKPLPKRPVVPHRLQHELYRPLVPKNVKDACTLAEKIIEGPRDAHLSRELLTALTDIRMKELTMIPATKLLQALCLIDSQVADLFFEKMTRHEMANPTALDFMMNSAALEKDPEARLERIWRYFAFLQERKWAMPPPTMKRMIQALGTRGLQALVQRPTPYFHGTVWTLILNLAVTENVPPKTFTELCRLIMEHNAATTGFWLSVFRYLPRIGSSYNLVVESLYKMLRQPELFNAVNLAPVFVRHASITKRLLARMLFPTVRFGPDTLLYLGPSQPAAPRPAAPTAGLLELPPENLNVLASEREEPMSIEIETELLEGERARRSQAAEADPGDPSSLHRYLESASPFWDPSLPQLAPVVQTELNQLLRGAGVPTLLPTEQEILDAELQMFQSQRQLVEKHLRRDHQDPKQSQAVLNLGSEAPELQVDRPMAQSLSSAIHSFRAMQASQSENAAAPSQKSESSSPWSALDSGKDPLELLLAKHGEDSSVAAATRRLQPAPTPASTAQQAAPEPEKPTELPCRGTKPEPSTLEWYRQSNRAHGPNFRVLDNDQLRAVLGGLWLRLLSRSPRVFARDQAVQVHNTARHLLRWHPELLPAELNPLHNPKLSPEKQAEARRLLGSLMPLSASAFSLLHGDSPLVSNVQAPNLERVAWTLHHAETQHGVRPGPNLKGMVFRGLCWEAARNFHFAEALSRMPLGRVLPVTTQFSDRLAAVLAYLDANLDDISPIQLGLGLRFLHKCASIGVLEQILLMLLHRRPLCVHDRNDYDVMVSVYLQNFRFEEAAEFVSIMKTRFGVQPDESCFRRLLQAVCRAQALPSVVRCVAEMRASGIKLGPACLRMYLETLSRLGSLEQLETALEEIEYFEQPQWSQFALSHVVFAYLRRGHLDRMLKWLKRPTVRRHNSDVQMALAAELELVLPFWKEAFAEDSAVHVRLVGLEAAARERRLIKNASQHRIVGLLQDLAAVQPEMPGLSDEVISAQVERNRREAAEEAQRPATGAKGSQEEEEPSDSEVSISEDSESEVASRL